MSLALCKVFEVIGFLSIFIVHVPEFECRSLLLFLIDGFRYDYMDNLQELPGFRELVNNGVKTDYMTPEFPSLSYPNYYSLMTGRYCETHQMTGNYMWDEKSKKQFLIGTNTDSRLPLWWEGSEPLWITLQKRQKDVYMYYWPGCEVEIGGVKSTFCEEYVNNISEKNLADSIEDALNVLRNGNADMAAVYYEKIDVEGHHFGPGSQQVRTAIHQLDLAFQGLNAQIKKMEMTNQLNIMMLSDHGMTELLWMDKVIELDAFINMSDIIKMMDRGPVVSLWPKLNKYEIIYTALSHVPNMHVYRREEIPERFHYKGGRFVATMTLVAEPGWFITENKAKLPFWQNETGKVHGWQRGWHGYDNEFIEMRGFFLAQGPDFKRNMRMAPIHAVDVYNLMCKTLGVEPLPNNGSWSRVRALLNNSDVQIQSVSLWSSCLLLLGILQVAIMELDYE